MKKACFALMVLFNSWLFSARGQGLAPVPVPLDSVQLKPLRGPLISYSQLAGKNAVILVCFWSTNSEPSIDELNAINREYDRWKGIVSFKLLAVCIDQGTLLNNMRPTANMNDWRGFDVCADIRGDLQQALHFTNLPQSVILKNGQIAYQQSGFAAGTENYLFTKVQALVRGL